MSTWDMIVEEGKESLINTVSDPAKWGREEFLRSVKSNLFHTWLFFEDEVLVDLIWVENYKPNRAELHFCHLNEHDPLKVGLETQKFIMDFYKLDVAYGFIPASNSKALDFVGKLGWKVAGCLPMGSYSWAEGKSEDTVIVCLEV